MRDDDMSGDASEESILERGDSTSAMFGEFAVIGPGVQIILDGRQVSCSLDH